MNSTDLFTVSPVTFLSNLIFRKMQPFDDKSEGSRKREKERQQERFDELDLLDGGARPRTPAERYDSAVRTNDLVDKIVSPRRSSLPRDSGVSLGSKGKITPQLISGGKVGDTISPNIEEVDSPLGTLSPLNLGRAGRRQLTGAPQSPRKQKKEKKENNDNGKREEKDKDKKKYKDKSGAGPSNR